VKPFYEHGGVTIIHGDCREVVPALDLADVSVVLADTPYNQTSLRWDRWPVGWPSVIDAHVPRNASLWCFGSLRVYLDRVAEFAQWKLAQDLIWEKQNGSGFHADRFKRVHEQPAQWYRGDWAAVFKYPVTTSDAVARQTRRKGRPAHMGNIEAGHYVSQDGGPRLMRSVIRCRNEHGRAANETQKPIGIIEPMLQYSGRPGSTVLVPFAGSGTALVVAKQLGMRAIGIELREHQCEVAARRLTSSLQLGQAEARPA